MSGDVRAQEVSSGDLDFRAEFVVLERRISGKKTCLKFVNVKTNLIGSKHVIIEDLASDGINERVGDPCTIVSSSDLAKLVGANLVHGDFVGLGVVFDRNLSRHSAHGGDLSPGNMLNIKPYEIKKKTNLWQVWMRSRT